MRVTLTNTARGLLFKRALGKKLKNRYAVARRLKVSERTVREWQSGMSTLPEKAYIVLRAKAALTDVQLRPKRRADYWYTVRAGQVGARTRMRLYGNPGTPAGRKLGGFNSLKTHRRIPDGFIIRKIIRRPKRSSAFSELMGVVMGDGHVSKFQVGVTTNSETDREHAYFVKQLIENTFQIPATLSFRRDSKVVTIVASSKNVVEFFVRHGAIQGNKIKQGLKAPAWIFQKTVWKKSFLRGLFDTDGCVYQEEHTVNKKRYAYAGWALTSYAPRLRQGIITMLTDLGFTPVHRPSQKSVFMHKQSEIKKYFLEIGTHNPKHAKRYKKFIGRVA